MADRRSITSKINGLLGGRVKGSKNKATLEKEAAAKAYGEAVRMVLTPLFHSQLAVSKGIAFVYRIEHHGTGASKRIEHVLLEEPHEIADALDVIANHDPNGDDDGNGYVYIHVKEPQNSAIESMLNRGVGKAANALPGDLDKVEEVTVIRYAQ